MPCVVLRIVPFHVLAQLSVHVITYSIIMMLEAPVHPEGPVDVPYRLQ